MSHIITAPLPPHTDHIFASKHSVELPLRIFPSPNPKPNTPWLLYVHGGAFMTGQHWYPFPWYLRGFGGLKGMHIASISYRLAPHVRYEDMVEDCTDAFAWLRQHLQEDVPDLDIDNYAIAGQSAGGTLVLTLGRLLQPRPKAVVDVFGLPDFFNPFYYDSTPAVPTDIVPTSGRWTDEELEQGTKDRDPSQAMFYGPNYTTTSEEDLRKGWDTDVVKFDDKVLFHLDLRYYIRSRKRLFNVLFREDEYASREEWETYVRKWNPIDHLTKDFPPTVILHGTGDTMVPVEESRRVAEKLRGLGVEVKIVEEEGQQHAWDRKYDVSGTMTDLALSR